ncbi:MAG: carboxylating nicotinate-nucleotide diphosphorylase [Bacteroidota bacterium]
MENFSHHSSLSPQEFIRLALAEDIGTGDHTTLACIPREQQGRATLWVKGDGVLAGLAYAKMVLHAVDPQLVLRTHCTDGEEVKAGTPAMDVEGRVASILQAERLLLNIMQRMSGIATRTRCWSRVISHTPCRLLDTRKTTPLNRALEKEAVRLGGGVNHRLGLFDAILVKDNHVDACGGVPEALAAVRSYLANQQLALPVIFEVRSMQELQTLRQAGEVDRILLDNFSVDALRDAVAWLGPQVVTEASGTIREQNLLAYAETGVHYLSIGALTHSVEALDLSLKITA